MVKEHDINMISNWIANYFTVANKTNAIIGISGGIDSAVVTALCVQALGPKRIFGIILPIGNTYNDNLDAMKIINKFNIDHVGIDFEEVFNKWWQHFKSTPEIIKQIAGGGLKENNKMVRGNAKARFRMLTLYALSEMSDGLVVGTTNKSEAKIGYVTKYGDGGVDIEPIIQYYKTEVAEMAKLLDIPESIIDKPPSAGLWDGQTDEVEIGLSYNEIDEALHYLSNNKLQAPMGGHTRTNISKVHQMIFNNEHKCKTPPYYKRS